ncbi:ferric reductase Fre2p [Fusarium phyllophilum]|uniref:Ferric reductase Fre2p n=1 Tax=Fusarium phyllophilum TaxID=47803 RepID=A0A8H5IDZ7_9HYPO|nr:ferric reductase Fre2p [Fusarium phyllophilum]
MWSSTTMPALAIVLSALSFIPSASATVPLEGYGRDDYPVPCAQACSYAMPYNLDCPEYAGMTAEEKAAAYPSAACFANDTSYLTSMAYCIHTYCPKNVKIYKIEYFWEVKMIYDSEALTIRWPYPEALAQVNTTTAPKPLSPEETVFNRTISIDSTTYQSYMNGVKGYKAVAKNESMYSILAFMTCVMVPIGFSLLRFLPLPTSFRSKVYGYLIDPPAWGRQHSVATLGIGMVPTRGQALFILYLIGINCLATFAGYPNYTPNGIFPDRHYELMRHMGNRAGSVAFANIPVVILYAGRSSVLLRLTNWSYSTFLLLHRWTATICVVQVALHSLLWLRIMIEGDSYPLVLTYPYWYVGIVGTVAFSALIPFSMLPIRKIMYEVFLITHIVLTIGALVGSWYHIVFLYEDKGGFEIWLIIAFCFWGLERVLRILRISRYGIKKAYVTRIDDKYLRVDIPDVDAQGHCFAYFPTLSWRVWENHPFSIVNCSKGQLDGESIILSSASHTQSENEGAISPTEASASKEMGGAMSNIRQLRVHSSATKPGITLFVQNLRGMTAKLAKKADTGIAIPVLIESSYGHEDTTRFEPNIEYPNTLVISGGVGIAGVLSSLQASLSMYAKPLGTTKLYWGIKSKGLVDVVKSMIVGGDATEEKEGQSSNWGHIEAHVSVGERMDIKRVLTTELQNAIGGTTVVVCGPHAMCDEARYVCAAMARHGVVVRYVEESFTW